MEDSTWGSPAKRVIFDTPGPGVSTVKRPAAATGSRLGAGISPSSVSILHSTTATPRGPPVPPTSPPFMDTTTGSRSGNMASRIAIEDLQAENTQLRLRLVYLDEVMARRGFNQESIETEVSLRLEMERFRKQVESYGEMKRRCEQLEKDNNMLQREIAALQENGARLEQAQGEISKLAHYQDTHEQLRAENDRQKRGLDLKESEIASLRCQISDMEEGVRQLQRTAEERWNEEMLSLRQQEEIVRKRQAAETSEWMSKVELKDAELEVFRQDARELLDSLRQRESKIQELRDTLDSKDDQIVLANNDVDRLTKLRETDTQKYLLALEEKDHQLAGERQLLEEVHKASATEEAILVVYKRKFQHMLEILRLEFGPQSPTRQRQQHVADYTSPRKVMSEEGGIRSPISPPHPRPAVDSVAVQKTSEVLDATISDCLAALQLGERARMNGVVASLQKASQLTLMSMEENFSALCSRTRRLSNRLFEVSDIAIVLGRNKQRRREANDERRLKVKQLTTDNERLEEEVANSKKENDRLKLEMKRTKEEAEQMAGAKAREIMERTNTIAAEMRDHIDASVREAVSEIRVVFVNTNVLTKDFIERIRSVANQVLVEVSRSTDPTSATSSPRRPGSPTGALGYSSLPTPSSPSSTSRQYTIDHLGQQTGNIVKLLETNLKQAGENRRRLELILTQWEDNIVDELMVFEKRFHELGRVKSMSHATGKRLGPLSPVSPTGTALRKKKADNEKVEQGAGSPKTTRNFGLDDTLGNTRRSQNIVFLHSDGSDSEDSATLRSLHPYSSFKRRTERQK